MSNANANADDNDDDDDDDDAVYYRSLQIILLFGDTF